MFMPVIPTAGTMPSMSAPQIMSALAGVGDRPRRPEQLDFGTSPLLGGQPSGWRNAMQEWRQQRMNALSGVSNTPAAAPGTPGVPPQLPPQANVPQSNPVFGQAPAGMVGGSYAIPGMKPAQSGFDLPTY